MAQGIGLSGRMALLTGNLGVGTVQGKAGAGVKPWGHPSPALCPGGVCCEVALLAIGSDRDAMRARVALHTGLTSDLIEYQGHSIRIGRRGYNLDRLWACYEVACGAGGLGMGPLQHVEIVVTKAGCGPKGLLIVACLTVLSQAACMHVLVAVGALLAQSQEGHVPDQVWKAWQGKGP